MSIAGKQTYAAIAAHGWQIWAAYHEDMTPREIGQKFGYSSGIIVRALRTWGLPLKKYKVESLKSNAWYRLNEDVDDRASRIIAARETGHSYEAIGLKHGISRERVRQILHQAGRSDLCHRKKQRPKLDKWVQGSAHKSTARGHDIKVSKILEMRRNFIGWHEIGKSIYPKMDVTWAARRVMRDVELACRRNNLDPSPAFYDLRILKKRWKSQLEATIMTHPVGTSLDRQPPAGKKWHDLVKQGRCRVCQIPLYGWEPIKRDVCGNSHCQAEAKRKWPCKFTRLQNMTP